MRLRDVPPDAKPENNTEKCTVAIIKADMDAEDRAYLDRMLASDDSGELIAWRLCQADFEITAQTVRRHRRGKCSCPKPKPLPPPEGPPWAA